MANVWTVIARRVVSGGLTVLILVTLVFFLMRFVGDPVAVLAAEDASQEQLAALEARLGLDAPLHIQYVRFLGNIVRGDFGTSFRSNAPATQLVIERIPATVELAAVALLLAVVIAIPVGMLAAVKPGSLLDSVSRIFAVLGQSLPVFWLGILLILGFGVHLGWFPTGGRGGLRFLVLPGIALSVYSIPLTMRLTRSAMLDVLRKDYIRTARAKGLRESNVILRYGLRNAMIPVVTIMALRIGAVISGAIVLEEVFSYPGLGRLGVTALRTRDFPVIEAFIVFVTLVTVTINLIADIVYTLVDPRVRLE